MLCHLRRTRQLVQVARFARFEIPPAHCAFFYVSTTDLGRLVLGFQSPILLLPCATGAMGAV
jgi:hypothetical protein